MSVEIPAGIIIVASFCVGLLIGAVLIYIAMVLGKEDKETRNAKI